MQERRDQHLRCVYPKIELAIRILSRAALVRLGYVERPIAPKARKREPATLLSGVMKSIGQLC